jgi:2',3'-cyclic-nucleotide 2'-phosphodiesterase (5'-nucleotidase family)
LATNDFLAGGGDGYTAFAEAVHIDIPSLVDYEVLQDYIQSHSPLKPEIEGRIQKVER